MDFFNIKYPLYPLIGINVSFFYATIADKISAMVLSDLGNKETGVVVRVNGRPAFRKRMAELGFIRGREIRVIKQAPLRDPIEYSVMGYNISLRKTEASLIEVSKSDSVIPRSGKGLLQNTSGQLHRKPYAAKEINVALIGNPNSGKTSIFNHATRSAEHVGNYSGVTIDTKLSRLEFHGYMFNIFDLPGTYSLNSYSPEEKFVRDFLSENSPDIVINILDSNNLERNLYLTTQLIDMNIRMVIALNMYDEFKHSGAKFDHLSFATLLGIPVIPTIGTKGQGLARLFEAVIRKHEQAEHERKHIHIHYGNDLEDSLLRISDQLNQPENRPLTDRFCLRYCSIKLLEKDENTLSLLEDSPHYEDILTSIRAERESIQNKYSDKAENVLADYRYGFINGALKETFTRVNNGKTSLSERVDQVLTHKYLGLPFFFILLWIVFMTTFKLGNFPVQWIEAATLSLSRFINEILPEGAFQHLLVDGVIGGIGGIIVFVPNILILFFFISLMEDTGYMARAAFIMDKLMHLIGLHGKSFIPLVMGFGCNVPAIMSTRIIESRNNRLLTILILPFMSCSARLPVYILIISAFFPNFQGTILFGIYLFGILMAVVSALLFKKVFFSKGETPFVMELPPYRFPTLLNTSRHMWNKTRQYIQKIGGVILLASIIIWGLNYYPVNSPFADKTAEDIEYGMAADESFSGQGESYLEMFGKKLQPLVSPLGFDWKATVSLLAGISAKEIVVSTMGVLYQSEGNEMDKLSERLRNEKYLSGPKKGLNVFSPAVAISFLMFTLIYFPCVAVIATVAKETGSAGWAFFLIFYTTGLAWIMSFVAYRLSLILF